MVNSGVVWAYKLLEGLLFMLNDRKMTGIFTDPVIFRRKQLYGEGKENAKLKVCIGNANIEFRRRRKPCTYTMSLT